MNYDQSKKTEALLKSINQTKDFLGKIGASQPHFRSSEVGKIHKITTSTTIHHQASTGDTNYHNQKEFDDYLALVITRKFKSLAAEALQLMQNDYEDSMITEENFLRERLAQIEALKSAEVAQ